MSKLLEGVQSFSLVCEGLTMFSPWRDALLKRYTLMLPIFCHQLVLEICIRELLTLKALNLC